MQPDKAVKVWEEEITFPTYGTGKPDKNPMFLEKRVYQGSSGKVYPYPITEKIFDEREDKSYKAVWLENEYIKILVLPELGGRIHRAVDKTNGCDFVYYNEVIKPALVGLLGPWISGGIEFNWPQHHRPTTFSPVDYMIQMNSDGSGTLRVSEVDQMYGTKGMASFTLYPGRAYIEIKGQLYNRTPLPQTFLWWANPAVSVNDDTQSIFPPDVHAVMDHGKRDVSRFPIATGTYYKHDYGAGVDISRYKNIPVPTSYMAHRSEFDFVGGYDYGKQAGILHVADHHVSPGKKQWTWGCGDFGRAWDRNLTDGNGPYIELMTGVYTDNQPDFTWLKPFEEKTFTQYFMPYKLAADVKNASKEIAVNLRAAEGQAEVTVYASGRYENARVTLSAGGEVYLDETANLSPEDVFIRQVSCGSAGENDTLSLKVYAEDGRLMLSYVPPSAGLRPLPKPAEPAKSPEEIATCEELYLTGLHIEQYRHATYDPEDYYKEGLKRDPGDIRLNTAYGMLTLRRGRFTDAETFFRKAIERLTWKNPNPYDGEAYYGLGLSLFYQSKDAEAYDAFYKSTWTAAEQEMGFYYLSAIDSRRGRFEDALAHIERSLVKNSRSMKARTLQGALLIKLGLAEEGRNSLAETLSIDPFCYAARFLLAESEKRSPDDALKLMGGRASSFIEAALDLAEAGFYSEAVNVLRLCGADSPMLKYHEAYFLRELGDESGEKRALAEAAGRSPDYCFPNRLEDIRVLSAVQDDARASYYLGNLWYDRRQYGLARECWERSAALDSRYPTARRNLSFLYYNKAGEPERALSSMERAFELDTSDARVFLELDQLKKKFRASPSERIAMFNKYPDTFKQRDDLFIEYVTLLNLLGRYQEAYDLLVSRKLHPWEGGEGKPARQYVTALTRLAADAMNKGGDKLAKELLERALALPESLGEGKLEGAKDNDIYYYLGMAERRLGNEAAAAAAFTRASLLGIDEPAGMMFYNDQPPEAILYQGLARREIGKEEGARERFNKLKDYGERHFFDETRIDYFAVSLPDMQLFDEDLTARNRIHCSYLIAMGSYGLGDLAGARAMLSEVLAMDPCHLGAALLRKQMP